MSQGDFNSGRKQSCQAHFYQQFVCKRTCSTRIKWVKKLGNEPWPRFPLTHSDLNFRPRPFSRFGKLFRAKLQRKSRQKMNFKADLASHLGQQSEEEELTCKDEKYGSKRETNRKFEKNITE